MSSAVVSTSAALGRPFLFDAEPEPEVYCHPERSEKCAKRISRGLEGSLPYSKLSPDPRLASITPASRLEIRPAPEMVTSGIPALDALTGGLPRGCLTEICGPASSGRTTVLLAALASATRRGEYCAVIDASDALDPHSLAPAGIDLDHLLWVRCGDDIPQKKTKSKESAVAPPLSRNLRQGGGFDFTQNPFDFQQREASSSPPRERNSFSQESTRNMRPSEHCLEQVLLATDLLLESGGFGLIILDLADLHPQAARRIPLTTWFRFRRAIEHKSTILLVIEQQPIAGNCSSLLLQLGILNDSKTIGLNQEKEIFRNTAPSHTHLFTALEIHAELIRSRLDRKPAQSITFETKTAWAG